MCTLNAVLKNMGVWIDKHLYDEAERLYYEKMAKVFNFITNDC